MTLTNKRYLTVVVGVLIAASVSGSVWLVFFGGSDVVQQGLLKVGAHLALSESVSPVSVLLVYLLICLITQLIVIPSGSVILIVSGFVLGPFTAAGIFSLAQILALFPVYRAAQLFMEREQPGPLSKLMANLDGSRVTRTIKREGLPAGIVLRLTPVVPSAAACCLAVMLQIPLRVFFLATVLVCWVRPLFFASIGGGLKGLSSLRSAIDGTTPFNFWPLLMVFVASCVLLVARLWLRRQQ